MNQNPLIKASAGVTLEPSDEAWRVSSLSDEFGQSNLLYKLEQTQWPRSEGRWRCRNYCISSVQLAEVLAAPLSPCGW